MNLSFCIVWLLCLGIQTLDASRNPGNKNDATNNGAPKKSPPRISCYSEDLNTKTKANCEKVGCIYDSVSGGGPETWCYYPAEFVMIDCLPSGKITRERCRAKGCHWLEVLELKGVYSCIYPPNYRTYRTDSPECASDVYTITNRAKCTPNTRNETVCKQAGCCWSPLGEDSVEPWCYSPWNVIRNNDKVPKPTMDQWIKYSTDRFNCFPRGIPNEAACKARGCFWAPFRELSTPRARSDEPREPHCFYPSGYKSYSLENAKVSASRYEYHEVTYKKLMDSVYPDDMELVQMSVDFETSTRVRIKIFHPGKDRFTSMYPKTPTDRRFNSSPRYKVIYNRTVGADFGFAIVREFTNEVLFDTRNVGGFTMADQFLQISAKIGSSFVYGLGESKQNMFVNFYRQTISFFARHESQVEEHPSDNLHYGSHPFYLALEPDVQGTGRAHGVLLLNSNALEVELQPISSITYRATGGILDFYFFVGDTPLEVIQEYHEVIGKPHLPPYWSLGFHLAKPDWDNLDDMKAAVKNSAIPVDVVYADMNERNKYYEGSNLRFVAWPEEDVKTYLKQLHTQGIKFVSPFYPAMNEKSVMDGARDRGQGLLAAFIKQHNSSELLTEKFWNSDDGAVYIDFTHPEGAKLWAQLLADTRKTILYDGVVLEYNEPCTVMRDFMTCPLTKWDDPPFVPRFNTEGSELKENTLCMSARHHAGLHYDVHNLYGIAQSEVTYSALSGILKSRPFIISRSTFPGSGRFAAHSMKNPYTDGWASMKRSVSEMVLMSMLGVPMVGTDICGAEFAKKPELCARWSVLGAFYPLSRYSSWDVKALHPDKLGGGHVNATRSTLLERYALLPYLYTLLYKAHLYGEPVVRPLFFEFPGDMLTYYGENEPFLWGSALLFAPILKEGDKSVRTYLPGTWYSYPKLDRRYNSTETGSYVTLNASVTEIPILIRAGSIIVLKTPAHSLAQSRFEGFKILVALDEEGKANGELYWDDGETLDSRAYNHILLWTLYDGTMLQGFPKVNNYERKMPVDLITIVGVKEEVTAVTLNITRNSGKDIGSSKTFETVFNCKFNRMKTFNVLEVNTTNLEHPLDLKTDTFLLKFAFEKGKHPQKKKENPLQKIKSKLLSCFGNSCDN